MIKWALAGAGMAAAAIGAVFVAVAADTRRIRRGAGGYSELWSGPADERRRMAVHER